MKRLRQMKRPQDEATKMEDATETIDDMYDSEGAEHSADDQPYSDMDEVDPEMLLQITGDATIVQAPTVRCPSHGGGHLFVVQSIDPMLHMVKVQRGAWEKLCQIQGIHQKLENKRKACPVLRLISQGLALA